MKAVQGTRRPALIGRAGAIRSRQSPLRQDHAGVETALPLKPTFRFLYEPIRAEAAARFVGRQDELEDLAERILFSEGGSFLVTGYRGVGKTSFVNQVIGTLRRAAAWAAPVLGPLQILDVQLSIARPLQPAELMHHIIRGLYERLAELEIESQLSRTLRDDLRLAYDRTSLNMTRKLAQASEHTFGINEAAFGLKMFPLLAGPPTFKASLTAKRSSDRSLEASFLAYDDRAAEHDLIGLSRRLAAGYVERRGRLRGLVDRVRRSAPAIVRLKIVFVFDELDKLEAYATPTPDGQRPFVDELLGSLKNLFTTSGISFVFVAGKDLQERWLEDLGRGDSVYESVFAYDQYLPCLWSDVDALCDDLVAWDDLLVPSGVPPSSEARCSACGRVGPRDGEWCAGCGARLPPPTVVTGGLAIVPAGACPRCRAQTSPGRPFCAACGAYTLDAAPARVMFDAFKQYLGFEGRGIPRRIVREFNSFVQWHGDRPALVFSPQDCRRVRCLAQLHVALEAHERSSLSGAAEEVRGAAQDKRRLGIRYLCDWVLRQGTTTFVLSDAVGASRRLSAMIALAPEEASGIVRGVLDLLLAHDFITAVGKGPGEVIVGSVEKQGEPLYQLVRRRLVELGFSSRAQDEGPMPPAERDAAPQVGRYRLREEIGSGGMGTVHRCWDDERGKYVAVKVLNKNLLVSAEAVERFRREAHIMSQLRHPNIVRFYETGDAHGLAYIVMDYIDGPNLAEVLRYTGKLSWETAVSIAAAVADALAYLHELGLVRNDVKPGNILLSRTGHVWLSDFGTTRAIGPEEASAITKAGELIGTPSYMAPEQIKDARVDARADVYAFGVVLYEMLVGRPPFHGQPTAVLVAQLADDVAPPSTFDPLPPVLDGLVLRCLAKSPEERPQTIADVRAALLAMATGDGTVLIAEIVQTTLDSARQARVRDCSMTSIGLGPPPFSPIGADAAADGPPASTAAPAPAQGPAPEPKRQGASAMPRPPRLLRFGADGELRETYPIGPRTGIGRSSDNEVVLYADPLISRYHTRIERRNNAWYVEDLDTLNGTMLNGTRLSGAAPLADGDRIEVGATMLEFRMAA